MVTINDQKFQQHKANSLIWNSFISNAEVRIEEEGHEYMTIELINLYQSQGNFVLLSVVES